MPNQLNVREKILLGARSCFACRGYVGATVPELERACRVTRRTLFKHFENKQVLLIAVLEQEIEARTRYFGKLSAGFDLATNLQAILEQLFQAQMSLTQGDRAAFWLRLEFIRMGELEPIIRSHVETMEVRQLRWRSGLLMRLIKRGLLHPDWSAAAATDLMSTMLLGLVAQESYEFPTETASSAIAKSMAHCLTVYFEGSPKVLD